MENFKNLAKCHAIENKHLELELAVLSLLAICVSPGDRTGVLVLADCKGLVYSRTNLYEGDLEEVSSELLPLLSLHRRQSCMFFWTGDFSFRNKNLIYKFYDSKCM